MTDLLKRAERFFTRDLWTFDFAAANRPRALVMRSLQILYALQRQISDGDMTLRAMGLVYTTLLSLVPLLAVSFSVLRAFDVHNQVQPLLENFLQPLGERAGPITENVIAFVENMKAGVLGSLGLAMLFYTVISLLQKIEVAFNSIWHNIRPRSLVRRFADYLSVLLIGPVLVFTALGVTASMVSTTFVQRLISIEPFGTLYYALGMVVPYLFIIGAFCFVYVFIPNTKVKLSAALTGAVVAGIAWKTAGWGFATFVAKSASYHAIYSGFAIIIMFMIWLYVSWLILLLGAQIAFYVQHPTLIISETDRPSFTIEQRERLGFLLMWKIAQRFRRGEPPLGRDELAEESSMPPDWIDKVLRSLVAENLLLQIDEDAPRFVPARDLAAISLCDVWTALRGAHTSLAHPVEIALPPALGKSLGEIAAKTSATLARVTLADITTGTDTDAATGLRLIAPKQD